MEERAAIDDKQIISLYQSGLSQNDIAAIYKVSLSRTRSVLKDAKFDTRGYRALNEWQKRVIVALVRSGVRYLEVERVTDISFHALRDYIGRIPRLTNRRTTPPVRVEPCPRRLPCKNELIYKFRCGTSFSKLAARYNLHERQILDFYHSIDEEILSEHRTALHEMILKDLADGLSVSIIARKYWISRAIVKQYSEN